MMRSVVSEINLSSLIYVSRSTLALDGDDEEVDRIVGAAAAHNGPAGITGSLLYTQLHFAQFLEGPRAAIEDLMAGILKDKRHCDVTVVAEKAETRRQFKDWAMAYSGPIPHLDRQLKPLLNPQTSSEDKDRLADGLIANFKRLQW
jgi:hypothetical protein